MSTQPPEEQYTYRDILGFLNDQQFYTDDSGHICIDAVSTAKEFHRMKEKEVQAAVAEVLGELEKLKSDYVLAPGGNHFISLHYFKSKILELRTKYNLDKEGDEA